MMYSKNNILAFEKLIQMFKVLGRLSINVSLVLQHQSVDLILKNGEDEEYIETEGFENAIDILNSRYSIPEFLPTFELTAFDALALQVLDIAKNRCYYEMNSGEGVKVFRQEGDSYSRIEELL